MIDKEVNSVVLFYIIVKQFSGSHVASNVEISCLKLILVLLKATVALYMVTKKDI